MSGKRKTRHKSMDIETECDLKNSEENDVFTVANSFMPDQYSEEEPSYSFKNLQKNTLSHSASYKRPITNLQSVHPTPFDMKVLAALRQPDALDDDDYFFKSLKPMLRQMDPVKKLNFRTEVQKLVLQFLEPTSSTSSPPVLQCSNTTSPPPHDTEDRVEYSTQTSRD